MIKAVTRLFVAMAIFAACVLLLAVHQQYRSSMISQRELCKDFRESIRAAGDQARLANVLTVAALINDVSYVTASTLDFLVDVTCKLQAPVHVLTANGKDTLLRAYHDKLTTCGAGDLCAELTVIDQDPDLVDLFPNRVDRLAHIREQQRQELSDLYLQGAVDSTGHPADDDFIIVVDLDLQVIPSVWDIEATMEGLVTENNDFDVVCANGMSARKDEPYDTYATILETDTWLLNPGSKEEHQAAMTDFKEHVADGEFLHKQQKEVMVPVKSCFGGLAIYRAKAWFDADCHYDDTVNAKTNAHLLKYRSIYEERVCEHVVFHDCLEKHHKDLKIGIDLSLATRYHDTTRFIALDGKEALRDLEGDYYYYYYYGGKGKGMSKGSKGKGMSKGSKGKGKGNSNKVVRGLASNI